MGNRPLTRTDPLGLYDEVWYSAGACQTVGDDAWQVGDRDLPQGAYIVGGMHTGQVFELHGNRIGNYVWFPGKIAPLTCGSLQREMWQRLTDQWRDALRHPGRIALLTVLGLAGDEGEAAAAGAGEATAAASDAEVLGRTAGETGLGVGERFVTTDSETTVYRVWGNGESGPWGRSWTPVDPRTIADYRGLAGLPTVNTGEYLSIGRLPAGSGVTIRKALALDGNGGGLEEWLLDDPGASIPLDRIIVLHPPF